MDGAGGLARNRRGDLERGRRGSLRSISARIDPLLCSARRNAAISAQTNFHDERRWAEIARGPAGAGPANGSGAAVSDPLFTLVGMKQRSLPCRGRGGYRPGSGRKRGSRQSHHGRNRFASLLPVHVVWRTQKDVRSLRGKRLVRQIRESFRRCHEKPGFDVVHFAVQGTHVHMIADADHWEALARGMQGLGVSIAKRVNFTSGRHGAVFDDRYFARILRTPRQCANAVDYVLQNDARHLARAGIRAVSLLDPYSSEALRRADGPAAPPLSSPPRSWLLCIGQYRARPAAASTEARGS